MPRFKMVNGNRVQLTAEEENIRDQEEAQWAAGAKDRAMASLRQKRNRLLAETDFYALSDVAMSEAMTTYRQDLRNLPATLAADATADDVEAVTFPTKPE